jgi:hypothetical protein
VAFLVTDTAQLCRSLAGALQIHTKVEAIAGLVDVYGVSNFIPQPGVKYSVFFIVRSDPCGYAEILDALRSRQEGDSFAVLTPTDRFLGEEVTRQMRTVGVTILALADVTDLQNGGIVSRADPLKLFSALGARSAALPRLAPEIVTWAIVCDGSAPHRRLDLDEKGYQELVATADKYDVFADERTKAIVKGPTSARQQNCATASHFRSIRLAIDKRGYFDPVNDDLEDLVSAQQIFQRARRLFDPRSGNSPWKLFKTVRGGERAVYYFNPDPGVSFAFIFLPKS